MDARLLLFTVFTALLVSCASKPAWQEDGLASYVADVYTGRPTSSGELYHPQAYTAAHHSLPFGTVVTVKNLHSGRTVNVTVNDRFPYHPGRVINLSSIAAQYIGIPYMSMAQVRVTARSLPQHATYAQRPSYGGGYPAAYPQQSAPQYYAQQQAPPQRQVYTQQPITPAPQHAAAPAYSAAPTYPAHASPAPAPTQAPAPSPQPAQRSWWRNPFSSGGSPNAAQFQGGNVSPPGLQTF